MGSTPRRDCTSRVVGVQRSRSLDHLVDRTAYDGDASVDECEKNHV
jgi:hypothetical protein